MTRQVTFEVETQSFARSSVRADVTLAGILIYSASYNEAGPERHDAAALQALQTVAERLASALHLEGG